MARKPDNDPATLHKQMLTIAAAVVLGQAMFLLVTSITPESPTMDELRETLPKVIIALFSFAMLAVGMSQFRSRVLKVAEAEGTEAKVVKYRTAFMMRAIPINLAGFVPMMGFFFTREPFYLCIVIPMMAFQIYFALQASSESQLRSVLELT